MRYTRLAGLLVLSLGVPATAHAQAASGAFRADVEAAVRAYVAAHNRGDAGAVAAMYGTQPGVTSIGDGEIVRGWDRIRERMGVLDSLMAVQGHLNVTLGSLDITALGNNYALAIAPYTLAVGAAGAEVRQRGAITLVLSKVGKDWTIIHDHTSSIPERPAAAAAAPAAAPAVPAPAAGAPPQVGQQVPAAPPPATPRAGMVIPIAAGALPEIPPQQVVHYDFQIPAAVCTVTGRVEGIAGGNKDFEVLILDDDGYRNWTAGLQARAFGSSGRVTVYTIHAPIPGPGAFHLVISNAFAVGVAKVVQVWAQVQCP
jgi:ketosteroid isomerase-like protein